MDLIAVDIDGTLASNRDQMDKYLSGFFTSYRRFFKAIRHATVNVEVADSVRDMAEQTGAQIAVITGRDGTYMKELNEFIARAGINPKYVIAKPGRDQSDTAAWIPWRQTATASSTPLKITSTRCTCAEASP